MIDTKFTRDSSGHIIEYKLEGHANTAPYGQDIVCAAASMLSINTVNSIEALAGCTPNVVTNDQEGGCLIVSLPQKMNQEKMNISQILLESLLIGLTDLAHEYPEAIQVKTVNI